MPTLVESDLLNRVKDNEELFDETISTNCISNFLSPNSSSYGNPVFQLNNTG